MSEVQRGAWAAFAPDVLPHLTAEDDPAFWEAALNAIFVDADALCGKGGGKPVLAQIGACSPQLTRLKVLDLRHSAISRAGAIPLGARFGGRVRLREGRPEDGP